MGKPNTISQTGAGSTAWIPMDYHRNPFNVGLGATVDGTATYTVQHTFEQPNTDPATTPTRIFSHETLDNVSESDDGNYAFPVAAIRLTVVSGAGTVTLDIIQAGISGG